jgi:signal transduction histidine kinase
VRHLVEDHLLCERLDAGGYPLRPQTLEVAELVEAALARGPAGDAPVERSVAAGLAVRGDRDLLTRALDALVAAAGTGPVRLSASPGDGRVAIRVGGAPGGSLEDPGRGTPADPRGRALALAAARRIAAAHGGTLEADPEGYLLTIPAA